MTVRKAGNFSKRHRRVPIAEVYSAISRNFHTAYANGTGQLGIEVVPAYGGVEIDGVTVPPDPIFRTGGWVSSERFVVPRLQMRGLETISAARRNGRGPDSFLISSWLSVCTRRSLTDSHSFTEGQMFTCAVIR